MFRKNKPGLHYTGHSKNLLYTMVNLKGKNLSERHKELNFQVIEAAKNKVGLQEVQCEDNSDIDRIFKIDLASKYENVDYVLDELKSGDSLYVSRALKCEWLYASDYAHLINPDYLHHHIFPTMSLKMKNRTLNTISLYVRDETRAQLFYKYCMNIGKWDSALKFLLFTSESFKNELLYDDRRFSDLCCQVEISYFRKFIGNSFLLADNYGKRERPIIELPYLYSLNEEEYLNLLEKHTKDRLYKKVGVKMSRSILKKHKDRILKYPLLYLDILNQSELLKYSSSGDAQVYAAALLPDRADEFWYGNYINTNKPILDLIKTPSMFEYIKKLFTDKYNTSEFEMTKEFYRNKYYNIMTFEEREAWALNHVQKQLDVLPEDESYKWYQFIAFTDAFKEIKTQIYITTDTNKRSDMLLVLVKSSKTQRDLEELLNYYYKRHVNETKDKKNYFIRLVMLRHKVLEFDDACWVAFELLLHSLDVYNPSKRWGYDDVVTLSLIYHIIYNKTLSENLQTYLKLYFNACHLGSFFDQLNDDKKDLVYNYMNQFLISILSEYESQEYSDAVKNELRSYLHRFPELRRVFHKEDKYPEIVIKYMKLDLESFRHIVEEPQETEIEEVRITEGYLLRCLKEDASLIVEKLPLIKDEYNKKRRFRINMLLRKIALFFSNDIAKLCLDFFTKTLYDSLPNNAIDEHQAICSIVFAIFQIGDEKSKIELMDKFTPTDPKIEHDKIGHYVLYTQQAICCFQCYSRPPVPLSKTALFLKGDYVHKCDHIFNRYLANLPPALRTEFIKLLLDSPLSIQKRGLRLAFKTFEASDLKDLVSSIWKKTKNVSLRQILYLSLFEKMVKEEEKTQEVLYALLKELTLTVHQDDTDEVFACFNDQDHRIPTNFKDSYLQTAWKVVGALPQKKTNIDRVARVIRSVALNMVFMNEEFLTSIISDFVRLELGEQKLRPQENKDLGHVNDAMWDLIASYIVDMPNETKQESSLKLVEAITKECLDNWKDHDTKYLIFQRFFKRFVRSLIQCSSYFGTKYLRVVHIFEYLLQTFENKFEISEMYSYFWDWKLDILTRKVINGKNNCDKEDFINFGLQLGELVKELKSKNLYYMTFFNIFYPKISYFIYKLTHSHDRFPTMNQGNVNIPIAYGLTQTGLFESYALALNILPTNPSEGMEAEYFEVIKKVKEQNNAELTAFLNDRLIYSDLQVREHYK